MAAKVPSWAAILLLPLGVVAAWTTQPRHAGLSDALAVDDGCASAEDGSDAGCALSAVQLLRAKAPSGRAGARPEAPAGVTFFTINTFGTAPLAEEVNDFAGRTGASVVTFGANRAWKSYRNKVQLQLEYLTGLRDRLGTEASAKELVVFLDSSDVMWGGCGMEEFVEKYRDIAEKQKASIVFNADNIAEFPKAVPEPLYTDFYAQYAVGCNARENGTWHDYCSTCEMLKAPKLRYVQPYNQYLNSGFFMGPVDQVTDMVQWVWDNFDRYVENEYVGAADQEVFVDYWLQHQDIVTLDYKGELCLALFNVHPSVLQVDAQAGLVQNVPLGRTQCFIHGPSRGRYSLMVVLHQLVGMDGMRKLDVDAFCQVVGNRTGSTWSEWEEILEWASPRLSSPQDGDMGVMLVPPSYMNVTQETFNTSAAASCLYFWHNGVGCLTPYCKDTPFVGWEACLGSAGVAPAGQEKQFAGLAMDFAEELHQQGSAHLPMQ